ncbi:MAG: hypothetical protein ABR616_18860 [Dermatophilaceae bacterium]
MKSIISWFRIEPRSDDLGPGPDRGLEARLYDPAWLIGRQWQLGELTGEDAASPAWVRVHASAAALDGIEPGGGAPRATTPGTELEPLVEGEARNLDWAGSVAAGQHWLATMADAGLVGLDDAFRSAFPVPDPDPDGDDHATTARFRVLRRRSLDGAALIAATRDGSGGTRLPDRPQLPAARRDTVLAALRGWAGWYLDPDPGLGPSAGAGESWVADRLEYRFSVTASDPTGPGTVVLEAPAYQGGRLDWHDLRGAPGRPDLGPTPERWVHAGLPTRVSYPGMPANRWWELEDGAVSFPEVESDAGDLARMLLVEFAAVYGNDWFLAPLDVPFGSLLAVEGVVVVDTFGQRTLVQAAQTPQWRMFELSQGPPGTIAVPAVVVGGAEGEPVEEVALTRDETANLAWAIERTVTGPAGQRVDRYEQWRDRLAALPERSVADLPANALVYDLADAPPDHWTPLVPVSVGTRAIRLRRGVFVHQDAAVFPPRGQLLDPAHPFAPFEEEVPRPGLLVTRSWQVARSADGQLLAWLGRRARTGRGESRSQVAFDQLRPDLGTGRTPAG